MKTDKTNKNNQRQYNVELTEEQLTMLLQEAYKDEIPDLSEELLQQTLEKAKEAEYGVQEQSRVQSRFMTKFIGNVVVKRCGAVCALCMLLFICGKIVQENGAFVQKDAAPENYTAESVKNETSGSMYASGNTGNDIGLLADSEESMSEDEMAVSNKSTNDLESDEMETTDGLSKDETGTTDNSAMEKTDAENEQYPTQEELHGDYLVEEPVEKESIYENIATLLPLFPQELYGKEVVYELWIDGVQVESGWEKHLEQALRESTPQLLALLEETSSFIPTEDTKEDVKEDTIYFSEQDILFTLFIYADNVKYCMEVSEKTRITVTVGEEKRSAYFAILDLTPYKEILTIKL